MSSDIIINENSSLNELYSAFHTRSSSTDSSYSSNKNDLEAETSTSNPRKDSTIKLPYPVLSDHRDPSSVLPLLQKETQGTSKKIFDVIQQIESCEKRLTSNLVSEKIKISLKSERIKRKQQLDALKKHERRVNLQIDYITTKTEIKALEDEQQQATNSDETKQFEILLKKLKQKLDQMKIYMKTRNDQMKKLSHEKQQSSTSNHHRKQLSSSQKPQQQLSSADLNRKRPSSSTNTFHSNKHFKSTTHNHNKPPIVRLASSSTSHQRKSQPIQTPIVRFLNKTTDSTIPTINSSSPTTPASSSSTLSPPLIASTSTGDANHIPNSLQKNKIPSMLEDGELDVEFDIDELFNDDLSSDEIIQKTNKNTSNIES